MVSTTIKAQNDSKAQTQFPTECQSHFIPIKSLRELKTVKPFAIGRSGTTDHAPDPQDATLLAGRNLEIAHLARFFDVQHMHQPVIQFVDPQDHGPN
jgi:hypothetical protein